MGDIFLWPVSHGHGAMVCRVVCLPSGWEFDELSCRVSHEFCREWLGIWRTVLSCVPLLV